ncbi:BA14K family protein [Mesorhizobium atlanticum]
MATGAGGVTITGTSVAATRRCLELGLGLGLGSLAYNNYYDPYYYDPYPRYYQPRRIYRTERLSRAHVQWCYDRYRSYRAWDNTFQPNYGPRRQCISPYI